MTTAKQRGTTLFLGCSFTARYRRGGGNFSVPVQWLRGALRLGHDAVWVELLDTTGDPDEDARRIRVFHRRLRVLGLGNNYCLILRDKHADPDSIDASDPALTFHGISRREFLDRLAGPHTLLNLSYSIRPPFLLAFRHRVLCDLDPCEFAYWMNQLEMGQSSHHAFFTIGLNCGAPDCGMPKTPVQFQTFVPLVDTTLIKPAPRPAIPRFTTIGQWWWDGSVMVNGQYPDLSKRNAFQPYLHLPREIPQAHMELAMNITEGEVEDRAALHSQGWHLVPPHRVVTGPGTYYRYIRSALAEFTLPKMIEHVWRSGWVSDRAIAFLATGRPAISQDVGAAPHLPPTDGMLWFSNPSEAAERIRETLLDWDRLSRAARDAACDIFDAPKPLSRILDAAGFGGG